MNIFDGIILGIVQGLTEFLPISSSGHLILARDVLNFQQVDGLAFDAVLQLATALAVLVYFRQDFKTLIISAYQWLRGHTIENSQRILLLALFFGTIPAVVAGLLLEEYMETTFRSSELVAWTLLLGAGLFFVAERCAKQSEALSVKKGIAVGFFQVLALIPGMSRSGVTIAGGLFMGLTRENAARFSFLLAFPIIFGSGLKKLLDLFQGGELATLGGSLLVGAVAAFIVGMLAIHYLLRYLRNHTLNIFIIYRVLLALLIFMFV